MQHQNSPWKRTVHHHSEMLSLQEALNCLRKQIPPSITPSPQGIASLSRVTSKMIFWLVSWGLPTFAYDTLLYSWHLNAWRSLMCPRCRTVPLSLYSLSKNKVFGSSSSTSHPQLVLNPGQYFMKTNKEPPLGTIHPNNSVKLKFWSLTFANRCLDKKEVRRRLMWEPSYYST